MIDYELQKKERLAKAETLLLGIPLTQARLCAKVLTMANEDWDFNNDFLEGYIKDAQLVRLLFNAQGEAVTITAGKGEAKQKLSFPSDSLLDYVLFTSSLGRDLNDACSPSVFIDDEGNEVEQPEREIDEVLAGFWEEFDIDSMIAKTKALKSDKNTWIPKAGMIAAALDEILQGAGDFFRNQTQRRSFIFNLMEAALDADFYKRRMITEANIKADLYETWESLQARCISQTIEAFLKNEEKVGWLCKDEKLYDMNDFDTISAKHFFPNLWKE